MAVEQGFDFWANPSSPHAEGRKARSALEDARERILESLEWDGVLVFTSGASEAIDIALNRARAGARLVSLVEHESVLQSASEAERLPVLPDGALDILALQEAIDGRERPLVAVQSINSETGNAQDIASIARLVHENDGVLLVDCAQSCGKFPVPAEADMVVISAHKFGGPIGIGALLLRGYGLLEASGGHERGYRRGTENLPGALGMAAALEECGAPYLAAEVLEPFAEFAQQVRDAGGVWLSDQLSAPTPNIMALAMPVLSGSAQVMRFDMAGIAISQGSACSSGRLSTSHVLRAMGLDEKLAGRIIRVSPGWNTSRTDIERFCSVWLDIVAGAS